MGFNRRPIVNLTYNDNRLYLDLTPRIYVPNSCYREVFNKLYSQREMVRLIWTLVDCKQIGSIKTAGHWMRDQSGLKFLRRAVQSWLLREYDIDARGIRISQSYAVRNRLVRELQRQEELLYG